MNAKAASQASFAAIALLMSNVVFAQAQPTVVVAFIASAASAVPLDPWASLAAGLLIAAIAYLAFRRHASGGFGRLGVWLAAVAAATAAMVGAARLDIVSPAQAFAGVALDLSSSPASVVVGSFGDSVLVTNVTGHRITLTSVTLLNPAANEIIEPPPLTTCHAGLAMQPGATCFIQINILS